MKIDVMQPKAWCNNVKFTRDTLDVIFYDDTLFKYSAEYLKIENPNLATQSCGSNQCNVVSDWRKTKISKIELVCYKNLF